MNARPRREDSPLDLSSELVRRIHDGDTSAWEDLYLRMRDPLLFSIRCRMGSKLRARLASEDVLHSVIKDAFRDLEGFESRGPGSLSHYLHVCVLNKIRGKAEYFDAQKRRGAVPLSDSLAEKLGSGADEPRYLDTERFGRLEGALARLPEEMRETVILRLVEGLTNREAADVLGKSEDATSKVFNRALARLGTLMQP